MRVLKSNSHPIQNENDVVTARQVVRKSTLELQFSLTDQTKMVTAASEIARNTLIYGKGGEILIEVIEDTERKGLRLVFIDQGPGIPNIELALRDGYTSGNGLGLGLSGSKRLVHEFEIESFPTKGTRITLVRWK